MTTRLSIDLEDDLHKEFSKAVIDVEETKTDVVRKLVREWVAEQNE